MQIPRNWKVVAILRCKAVDNGEHRNLHASLGALKGREELRRPTPSSTKLLFLFLAPIEGPLLLHMLCSFHIRAPTVASSAEMPCAPI